MRYLVDANVWLDLILDRSGSADVQQMLATIPGRHIATTDFALHATGIYVKKPPEPFLQFLDELIANEVGVLHLPPTALRNVVKTSQKFSLDFDDAFHVVAAERFALRLVSFDTDYDRTPLGRLTPAQALADFSSTRVTP